MKKAFLIIMVMVIAAASVVALTACSAKPEGTYKLQSVNIVLGVGSVTYESGESYFGETLDENTATLTINKDGTYLFEVDTVYEISRTGTWELVKYDSGTKQIKFDNDNVMLADFTKEGLTVYYNYFTFKMKRV